MIIAIPEALRGRQERAAPPPRPSPNAPTNQNAPKGLDGPPSAADSPRAVLDRQNEQEIRMSVQRLYALASQLKDDVDRTNSNAVFDASIPKRAQEIEKLAKQIRDRVRH